MQNFWNVHLEMQLEPSCFNGSLFAMNLEPSLFLSQAFILDDLSISEFKEAHSIVTKRDEI